MSDKVLFVPLGGSGEIGMNLNLYGYKDTWLMVDCGMMISSESGQDEILVPEIDFLRGKNLAGLVLTHAHEDHIGAITDLWLELRCPLYTTPFTAAVIRRKISESAIKVRVPMKIQPPGGHFKVECFDCEFIPITHSTVESQSLMIRTPVGAVFHTGDWKLDPDPLVGKVTAIKRIKELGREGIRVVVGDSTNADLEGTSGSEFTVKKRLRELILEERGRVVCASFSSNIARLQTFLSIAEETGRSPVLVGRSLKRMVAAAQETGYLSRSTVFVPPRDAMFLPPERVLLICTGSQGEARAALSRIANQTHPEIYLTEGDTVFFSSKVIPGNELGIEQLKRALSAQNVKVIDETEEMIHVSGHPCIDELHQMYEWLKPEVLIPVHGYPHHLSAHAQVGRDCEIPQVIEVMNGDIVSFDEKTAEITGHTPTGRRLRPPDMPRRGRRGGKKSRSTRQDRSRRNTARSKATEAEWSGDTASSNRQSFLDGFSGRAGSGDSQERDSKNKGKKKSKNKGKRSSWDHR